MTDIRSKWEAAYKKAAFYNTQKNTKEYWDSIARADEGSLSGSEHIDLILDHLLGSGLLNERNTVLDVGCGSGDHVAAFAKVCRHVTALDYSVHMIDACRSRCEKEGLANVSYVEADFNEVSVADAPFDCVLACLNPSTYNPEAFDKLLSITRGVLVYFTMDTDIGNPDAEPVYCGCNSVRFAEEYLKEMGLRYTKIPYVYELEMEGRDPVNINFAYLIIRKV